MTKDPIDRLDVYKRCLQQIDSSDVVYAWLNDSECYGTLYELGYACAKGKQVFLAKGPKLPDELWFATCVSGLHNKSVYSAPDAISGFYTMITKEDQPWKRTKIT